jgi:amidase
MNETKQALLSAGHKVLNVDLFQADDQLKETAFRIYCADGGQELRETLAILEEPHLPETMQADESMALTAAQLGKESRALLKIRQTILQRWQQTARLTGTDRPVDVFILPSGAHVAPPHGTMDYFLYEAISNIIDCPCATIPVGIVDPVLDPMAKPEEQPAPLSALDKTNQEKCKSASHPTLNHPWNQLLKALRFTRAV